MAAVRKGTGRPAATAKRTRAAQKPATQTAATLAKTDEGKTVPKAAKAEPKVREYRPVTPGLSGNGDSKARHVAGLLKGLGWSTKLDGRQVSAAKGDAVLVLVWNEKGRHDADASSFQPTKDAKSRRVINVATAMRFAQL